MAFSQSFDLGDSTFMELQNLGHDESNEKKDVIAESPTETRQNSKRHKLLGARNGSRVNSSKSYSTIDVEKAASRTNHNEYSAFFQSNTTFSMEKDIGIENILEDPNDTSVSSVSQLEADFLENEADQHTNFGETTLFDGVAEPLETEHIERNESEAILNEEEEIPWLDETSFITRSRKNESSAAFVTAKLNKSRAEINAFGNESDTMPNISIRQKSNELPNLSVIESNSQPLANVSTLKLMSAWNLPLSVQQAYERKGVREMFDWQVDCLSNPKVLFEHRNLVYSAPTSAGKTLVSEILLLKTVLERDKKVLVILPFISVVREKMLYLQDLLAATGYRVEGFFGGYMPPGGFDSIHVAICTIEKANSIVNRLLEQNKLDEIGTIVVDEVHLISDPGRGYILELLLAKILYMSRKYGFQIQIVTMSATLANVDLLKRWLCAELFITDFRPVVLQEMIKVGTQIFDCQMTLLRDVTIARSSENEPFPKLPNDNDNVAQLCLETLLDGCSVIVFCPSKDWCENLAKQLANTIRSLIKNGDQWGVRLKVQLKFNQISEMKQQLCETPTGVDSVLEKTIAYGCAFHHAGLTMEERDIIESSFKSGALKIIVATSTLSSGVNLPARRVIIRSPLFGGKQMSSLTYRQMIGRAGRMGKDTMGESILICTDSNARIGRELVQAGLKPISSCLEMDSSTHLKRALLEVISSGVVAENDDIKLFATCTLLSVQKQLEMESDMQIIDDALNFLIEYEFIRRQTNEETKKEKYVATRLGMACLASSMPPTDGLILFAELQKSRRCFVLESELHAVYLVTPYSVCYQLQNLDWLLFLDMWERLTPAMKKVGELVGIKESFLVRAMRGQANLDYNLLQIHKRFYTALALQELVDETPISTVAAKYKCTRGLLQSLQQMAATFAGIVTAFCNSLQWSTLSLVVSQFRERLFFGVQRDLIDLLRLPDLNHKRARALCDAGVTTLVELANSDVFAVERILRNLLSFDSDKQHEHEDEYEAQQRMQARNFFITGRAGLTVPEAAKLLVTEARAFVQLELGVNTINWTQPKEANEIAKGTHISEERQQVQSKIQKRKSDGKEICAENISPKLVKMSIVPEVNTNVKATNLAFETTTPRKKKKKNKAIKKRLRKSTEQTNGKENIQEPTPTVGSTVERHVDVLNVHQEISIDQRSTLGSSAEHVSLAQKPNKDVAHSPLANNGGDMDTSSQDNSFELHSYLQRAYDTATSNAVVFKQPACAFNKSNDEIPNSQPAEEQETLSPSVSRHQSRFTRSIRTTATPRTNSKADSKAPQMETQRSPLRNPSPDSSFMELSDLYMGNSLIQQPIMLNSSHILNCMTEQTEPDANPFESVNIINVCGNELVFQNAFKKLHENKRLSFCLGLQQQEHKQKPLIGANLLVNQVSAAESDANEQRQQYLFNIDDSTYLACLAFCFQDNVVFYINMQQEGSCDNVTAELKCNLLQNLLQSDAHTLLMFDAKEQIKVLRKVLPQLGEIRTTIEDPKVASWMMQPEKHFTLQQLTQEYAPECAAMVELCSTGRGFSSFGLDISSGILAKVRSCTEACVTLHVLRNQIDNLEQISNGKLLKFFKKLEMPLQLTLANMEVIGFPVNEAAMCSLSQRVVDTMKIVEKRIYAIHGSVFNLSSSQAVARILGLHRKPNGRVVTSRQILEKIETPIAQLILMYRKMSTILANNIQPLLKCIRNNRIHGQSITHTATGRISMTDPNLQNVAKDFDVDVGNMTISLSCRSVFMVEEGSNRCLLSSDFCQLEMRILAHLSQDTALIYAMCSHNDFFTVIAAHWNQMPVNTVTDQLRNGTKQICYAIIYGMGMRSLADALKCTEREAQLVYEQFHSSFPGIRIYTERVLKHARKNEYVETITGRRRYLEHINSSDRHLKSQAERQALNTVIQGSAADITKCAILRMEHNLAKYRDKLGLSDDAVRFVLHLHDEIIFEVPQHKVHKIAKVACVAMENCANLNIPLKVKIKYGQNWGELTELKF